MMGKFEDRQRRRFDNRQKDKAPPKINRAEFIEALMNDTGMSKKDLGKMQAAFESFNSPSFLASMERMKKSSEKMGDAYWAFFEQLGRSVQETANRGYWKRYRENLDGVYVYPGVHAMGKEEDYEVEDHSITPQEGETQKDKLYVVYRDEGLTPQVQEVVFPDGEGLVEDMLFEVWTTVEYLIGEDLDPVSVVRDDGGSFGVMAYRRADSHGVVYQDGWVGAHDFVPEELRETSSAKRKRKLPEVRFFVDEATGVDGWRDDPRYNRWQPDRDQESATNRFAMAKERAKFGTFFDRADITVLDIVHASQRMPGELFVEWMEHTRPPGVDWASWVDIIGETIINENLRGRTKDSKGHLDTEKITLLDQFREHIKRYGGK